MSFPADGTIVNGAVWINGEPMCLDLNPALKRLPVQIVQDSMTDRIAYIKRLQVSVDVMAAWLKKNQ